MSTYLTLDEFQALTDYDSAKYGTVTQFFLDTAEDHINNITNHRKWIADSVASARLYSGTGDTILLIDECIQVTGVSFKFNSSDASFTAMTTDDWYPYTGSDKYPDFNTTPYTKLAISSNGDFSVWPVVDNPTAWITERYQGTKNRTTIGYPNIQVTAKWGYAVSCPEVIKTCMLIQTTRWIKRAEGVFGDAIGNADTGQIRYVSKMDADMKTMLTNKMIKPSVGKGK